MLTSITGWQNRPPHPYDWLSGSSEIISVRMKAQNERALFTALCLGMHNILCKEVKHVNSVKLKWRAWLASPSFVGSCPYMFILTRAHCSFLADASIKLLPSDLSPFVSFFFLLVFMAIPEFEWKYVTVFQMPFKVIYEQLIYYWCSASVWAIINS